MATGTKDKPTLADAVYKTDEQEREDAKEPIAPVRLWQRISKKPWVAHLIRMMERFGQRLGSQFAAAITYFSFFSLVPMLMVSFAITGIVLSSQPALIDKLKTEVSSVLSSAGGETGGALNGVIDNAVQARWSIGIVALLLALYTAIGWMTNLRMAVRAQWRQDFEEDEDDKETFFVALGKDLLALVVLGLGILVSVVLTTVGSGLTGFVAKLFGVDDVGWITAVLSIVPIALAIGVSTLLFFFLYRFLPRHSEEIPRRKIWRGAIAAAVIYEVLKLALSILIQKFSASPTAAVFGSVIALLAFINLVARMILMIAAWIGTSVVTETGPARDEKAVVIRPVYRVRSMPAVAGGVGIGAAVGWIARKFRRG